MHSVAECGKARSKVGGTNVSHLCLFSCVFSEEGGRCGDGS